MKRPKAYVKKIKNSCAYQVIISGNTVYESDYCDCKSWVEAYNKGAI